MRYIHLSLILILCSCSSKKQPSVNPDVQTIKVDINKIDNLYMSDFFHDIEYELLKTPKGQPIGRIEKIQVSNNYLILFDSSRNSVWIFRLDGRYVNKIHIPEGRGPGEVEHLSDIYFDKTNRIHALGFFKIVVFDINGNLIDEIDLDFKVNKINYDHTDKLYYGYIGVSINPKVSDKHKGNTLYVFNKEGNIVKSFIRT